MQAMICTGSPSLEVMTHVRLDIYVEHGCFGCRRATELANWVRDRFSSVQVRLISPADDTSDQARLVAATPTYFINGQRFSLGNPSEDELERALQSEGMGV